VPQRFYGRKAAGKTLREERVLGVALAELE